MSALLDPMFRVPFLTGLCFAVALPLGMYLRLREEWLAALARQRCRGSLAAATPLSAFQLAVCAAPSARWPELVHAHRQQRLRRDDLRLVDCRPAASHVPVAEHLGYALFDGQLASPAAPSAAAAGYLAIGGAALGLLSRPCCASACCLDFRRQRQVGTRLSRGFRSVAQPGWRWLLRDRRDGRALVFVPSMVAYRLGPLESPLLLASILGLGGYLLAFVVHSNRSALHLRWPCS